MGYISNTILLKKYVLVKMKQQSIIANKIIMYQRKNIFFLGLLYLNILLSSCSLYTTVVVRGNDETAPFGFTAPVNTTVFDCRTGTFYVGLPANGTDSFAVSKGPRPNFNKAITFTGIAVDSGDVQLVGQPIEFLALSLQEQAAALLGIVVQMNGGLQSQTISVLPTDNRTDPLRTDILNDANSNDTAGIIGLAANEQHLFAVVRPQAADFGADGGGIALIETTLSNSRLTVTVKDANTGLDGNQALGLNAGTTQVKGSEGGQDVIFAADGDTNQIALYYDASLQRLYIGLRIATNNNMNDIGKSVVVARLVSDDDNDDKKLELQNIVADSAIGGEGNQIIVARDMNIDLRAINISIMHASTGPSYLIVNGGTSTTDQIGNQIFAFPLVDDPDNEDNHGSLANKNAPLVNGVFITPATIPNQVPIEMDEAARVGTGLLPIEADKAIAELIVIGDTVYVALNTEPDNDNDTGILFSQALFDSTGKIIRWTPWTKRATPFNAFPGTTLPGDVTHDGRVNFFAIDAKTGNAWIVEGTTGQVVGITNWQTTSRSPTTNNLLTNLTTT